MEKQSLVQEIPIKKRRRDAYLALGLTVIGTGFILYAGEIFAALAFCFFGLTISIFILRTTHDYTKLTPAGELAMNEFQENAVRKNAAIDARWGITRDEDGNLAYIIEWPWYWRYPVGLLIVALTTFLAMVFEDRSQSPWVVGGVALAGLLFALSTMYELGCLAIVLAVIGGAWWATDTFLPDYEVPKIWIDICLGIAIAIAVFNTNECLKQIAALRKELTEARQEAGKMAAATNTLIARSQISTRKKSTRSVEDQENWEDIDWQDDQ
jgi:hypothetical protein